MVKNIVSNLAQYELFVLCLGGSWCFKCWPTSPNKGSGRNLINSILFEWTFSTSYHKITLFGVCVQVRPPPSPLPVASTLTYLYPPTLQHTHLFPPPPRAWDLSSSLESRRTFVNWRMKLSASCLNAPSGLHKLLHFPPALFLVDLRLSDFL